MAWGGDSCRPRNVQPTFAPPKNDLPLREKTRPGEKTAPAPAEQRGWTNSELEK